MEKQRLGFVPQKELVYCKQLPYFSERFDEECLANWDLIKTKLGESAVKRELRPAFVYWLAALSRYLKLYGLLFSKQDHLNLVRLLFEVCVEPDMDLDVVGRCASALTSLVKKKELLSRDDLVLDWKPLFALYERVTDNRYQRHLVLIVPGSLPNAVRALVRACRVYFSLESTEQMLDLWSPLVCPYLKVSTQKAVTNFQLFLPTLLPPESSNRGYGLWLSEFLAFWRSFRTAPAWETYLMWLFSRLAQDNVGRIDWEPYIPDIFSRLLRSFRLPNGLEDAKLPWPNDCFDATAAANLVAALLGGGSGCQRHLDVLFDALRSYCHPSNVGLWNLRVNKFLSKLPETVVKRLRRERGDEEATSWVAPVPESHRLSDDDVAAFVRGMMDCVLLSMFGKMGCFDAALALKNLALLRPEMVVPPLLDRLYPALETLTEPHRLTAVLQCVTCTLRELVKGGGSLPEGPSHVLPVLSRCLPGIDPNDCKKSLVTFQLIEHMTTLVPIVDCSQAPDLYPDLTPAERETCLSTQGFEDFVLRFLDRCFVVVESFSTEPGTRETTSDEESANPEETVLQKVMVATFNAIVNQCSPPIYEAAVRRLRSFVSGRMFGCGVAGKTVAKLCGAAAVRDEPEEALSAFLPRVCRSILESTRSAEEEEEEEEASGGKRLGDEVLFDLLLLSELVSGDGSRLAPYFGRLLEVLEAAVWLPGREAHGIACTALSNLALSLSTVYPTERRSVPWKLDRPLTDRLPIKDWGLAGDPNDLNVDWHVPSPEEAAFVQGTVDEFLAKALGRLDRFCRREANMTRDQVKHCLKVAYHCLLGALPLCPKFQGPYENCVDSSVEMTVPWCSAVVADHVVTVNGADVRETVAAAMHRLANHLLAEHEDNTGAFDSILKIYGLLVFYSGVPKDDHSRRVKGYDAVKKVLEDRLSGKKRHIRPLLLQRVQILHERRVLESGRIGMTSAVATVFEDLVALSTSRYREVRASSQRLLQDCLDAIPHSYTRVLPALLPLFRKDGRVGEERLKGALHMAMGQGNRCLLTKRDWGALADLWPAVLAVRHHEEPSTGRLLDAVAARIAKSFRTFAIRLTVPESALPFARALRRSNPTAEQEEEEEEALRLQSLRSQQNLRNYERLVRSLTEMMADDNLHWQNYQLCFEAMGYLIRHDVPLPAPTVRCVLRGTVHESLAVRKLALARLVGVLVQQKPAYKRRSADRAPLAGPPRTERGFLTEYRSDNGWLQYDRGAGCLDRRGWDAAEFVHKHYFGFCSWPAPLEVYAPASEQPALDRAPSLLTEEERAVHDFFSHPSSVDRLVSFLSLEERKGEDKFGVWRSALFKGLSRNFGDAFLGNLEDNLRRLLDDPTESRQRCAAEMLSGLARGCKRWPFEKVSALWEKLVPLWKAGLANVTAETKADWSYAVGLSTSHRDPRSVRWLLELLAEGLPSPTDCRGSFLEASRIHMMRSALENQSWRTASFAVHVLERVRPLLAHPYQNIRKDLSRMLAALFKLDPADGPSPPGPKVGDFVAGIVPPLLEFDRGAVVECGDGDNGRGPPPLRESADPVALLKTVSGWICHHVKKCPGMKTETLVPLVPLLLRGEGFERDPELQRECLTALALVSQAGLAVTDLETVVELLPQVSDGTSWRSRRTMLRFLRVLVFSNLFTVTRSALFVRGLTDFVRKSLTDPRLEVRETAALTLSGLVHCRVTDAVEDLVEEARRWASTPVKGLPPRSSEHQAALVRRHAGVLGLCAVVRAHPYDVGDGLPDVLMAVADHLGDPPPIQTTVRATLSDFRRTHHDCWQQQHKRRFTDEQLAVLADVLVSPNYYA